MQPTKVTLLLRLSREEDTIMKGDTCMDQGAGVAADEKTSVVVSRRR